MLCTNNLASRSGQSLMIVLTAIAIFTGFTVSAAWAQGPGQTTFATPAAACAALVKAVEDKDQDALRGLLGPTANELITGGDDIEDRSHQSQFVKKYREMHRLVREPNGTTTLYVGAENWPVPIILRNRTNHWYFDPVASRSEILYRRVGRNELAAIQACRDLVAAQLQYFAAQPEGGVRHFASRFNSEPTKRNGLYWKISDNEPESPIGHWLSLASSDESAGPTVKPRPFRGYYFRIVDRQGPSAPGGSKSYLANGRMTGGFAFVAYPAEYRSSGVMTFLVSQNGIVYQKDLGKQTAARARKMTSFDPDRTWKKVDQLN